MEVKKIGLNQKEGLENAPKYDFRKIFLEKLESIEPIPEEDREDHASGFETIGIKKLKREAPVLVVNMSQKEENEQALDLWMTDPAIIKNYTQPHDEVKEDFAKFLGINKGDYESDSRFPKYLIGGDILQDDEGLMYLLVDEIRSKRIDDYLNDKQKTALLLNLLERYGIKKVAGRFWRTRKEGDWEVSGGETETIFDEDLIGERRENLHLLNIALKYHMTNTQFMRFRIMTKSSIDFVKQGNQEQGVKILRDLEEIAQEVINEDKE